jgi:hypothetical protein
VVVERASLRQQGMAVCAVVAERVSAVNSLLLGNFRVIARQSGPVPAILPD